MTFQGSSALRLLVCKCRRVDTLIVASLALALHLFATGRAEALQCPKGYVGGNLGKGPQCIMTAEHAKKLEKEQADKKKKQQDNLDKLKAQHEKCKQQPGGCKQKLLSSNSSQPNPPDNAPKAVGKKKKIKSDDVAEKPKPSPPSTNSSGPNSPTKDKGGPSATDNAKSTDKNTKMSNSPEPNEPPSKPPKPVSSGSDEPNRPDKGKKTGNRDADDDGDRQTNSKSRPRDDADDDAGTRKSTKASDGDGGKRKSAKAADDDDAGASRKGTKASDDNSGTSQKAAKSTGAPAATASLATGAAAGAAWSHNNSRMSVANDGNQMTIAYEAPRDGLASLGIKPGTPLFKGTRDGNKVSGEATTFTRKCGTRTYPVSGTLANGRVELSGDKPVLDGDCGVSGTTRERLIFETDD